MQNNNYYPPQNPNPNNYYGAPHYQQPNVAQQPYVQPQPQMPQTMYPPQQLPQSYYFNQIQRNQRKELVKTGLIIGATLLAMLAIQVIEAIVLELSGISKMSWFYSSAGQNIFNAVFGHILSIFIPFFIMSKLSKKRFVTPVVPKKKIATSSAVAWVAFGMGCCILADFLVMFLSYIASNNGYELNGSELPGANSVLSCFAEILSTILLPAIIEEYAFRCCSLGVLRKYGKGFAVAVVSIIFGMIHGNIIQFIFATSVGVILGFITVKTDNVIIAAVVHGLNNSLSVIGDITSYISSSEELGTNLSNAILFIWPALGIIGMIYLIRHDGLFKSKYSKYPKEMRKQIKKSEKAAISANPYILPLWSKILCVIPGFLLFCPFYIYSIITTIVSK